MILITYLIVTSGLDWKYFQALGVWHFNGYISPAIMLGTVLPILLPLALLVGRQTNTAWALGQAAMLGSLISSTYKAFTGRIPPHLGSSLVDISHGFQFGFLHGGVFWGWPSSHTTIAFAMALTLINLYPKNKLVKYLSLFYAVYVGIAVSVSIHWLSEFIAGAILGSVIGNVVGQSFRHKSTLAVEG
jgi:membrane-associated phospholipid phosphatase